MAAIVCNDETELRSVPNGELSSWLSVADKRANDIAVSECNRRDWEVSCSRCPR